MYYIKKIFLTGNGVETSGVDLTPGLNIIYGPSETGKSYITKCIKFMYGKKDSEIDDTFGFNTIHMILDVDGKPLTLVRRLDEEKINVSGNIDASKTVIIPCPLERKESEICGFRLWVLMSLHKS